MSKRVKWMPRERAKLVEEWRASGSSAEAFGRRHGVAGWALYRWSSQSKSAREKALEGRAAFQEIQVRGMPEQNVIGQEASSIPSEQRWVMEIGLQSGIRIRVTEKMDMVQLREVLELLEG